jgi:glycine cleavage system H protein
MATTRKNGNELIPGADRRCIWMSAGLVAYKLCDRDFECERCPLDRALRGGEGVAARAGAETRSPAPALVLSHFPDDRLYHPTHTWVSRGPRGRTRIGLDAFAARLAGPSAAVIAPAAGSPLRQGEVACWLDAGAAGKADTPIPIRSPISGTVRRRNPRLGAHPSLVATSPYDRGWLLEVDPLAEELAEGEDASHPARAESRALESAEMARRRSERQLAELLAEAAEVLGDAGAAVGPTLPDGGEPLADLRAVLGTERYRRLVLRYLS